MSVAEKLGIEYVELLKSKAKRPQKSLYGEARRENANFECKHRIKQNLNKKRVILIDDIITTGASMSSAAKMIKKLGTRQIIGACLGVAYKEKYIDFYTSAF